LFQRETAGAAEGFHGVMRFRILSLVLALGAVFRSAPARAGVPTVLEVGTDFPLDAEARVRLELPLRLQLMGSMGAMPSPYLDVANDVLVASGAYDQATANLIQVALQQSAIAQVRLGWRPWAAHGFYFDAGYFLAFLGGGISAASAVASASHGSVGSSDASNTLKVTDLAQGVTLEAGWIWPLTEHWQLRAGLGAAHIFASNAQVTHADKSGRTPPDVAALETSAATYLNSTLTTYVYTPVLSIAVGYWVLGSDS
jgi:hypothetical protein